MKRCFAVLAAAAALVVGARPAYAWDDFGHRVVARIAWANMTPHARERAIAILRASPSEMGLHGPGHAALSQDQQIEMFLFAATWPDVVRDTAWTNALRAERYHHPYRHYVDTFWRQDTDFGPIQPVDRRPEGDLLREGPRMQRLLMDGTPELKAVGLAWILHLVGDIHQPLHASGRVTPRDPWGDAGGNDFKLEIANPQAPTNQQFRRSLHGLWDGILTETLNAPRPVAPLSFLTNAAHQIMQHHPRGEFTSQLGKREFRDWANESVDIAKHVAYQPPLVRDQAAPPAYKAAAFQAAEARAALAGYRLADLLNRALEH